MTAFDLDAVLGEPFTFTFDGEEYALPVDVDWETTKLLTAGEPEEALHRLLGDDQWSRLEESPKVFGTRSFTKLLDAYMEHLGLRDVGESSASSPSSVNTAEQSRRTFSGSTESGSTTSDATQVTRIA
jgi:hypothetical protein